MSLDPDSSFQVIVFILLVVLSALFTAAETAMLTLNKYRLRQLVFELNPQAMLVSKLLQDPTKLYDTILSGDSLANIGAVVMGTLLAVSFWGMKWGAVLAVLVITFIIVSFGEILPKIIAAQNPEKICLSLIKVLYVMTILLYPLVKIVNFIARLFAWLMGAEVPQYNNGITEEEIINLVAAGQEDGVIHQEEKRMIHSVMEFTDTVARDVMVPRPDIVAVEKNTSFSEIIEIIKEEQFSRLPVYEDTIDNILGVVHIKDLIMTCNQVNEEFRLTDFLRQTFFVPETKKVNELLKAMKKEKNHMAVVLDEYGSTAGLVAMEDLIEEILGDIQDEHDTEEPQLQTIDADTVIANASLRIEELNEKLGIHLECEEADTLGGLVFSILDRVPAEGDIVRTDGYQILVEDMEGHRIERIRLTRIDNDESNFDEEARTKPA